MIKPFKIALTRNNSRKWQLVKSFKDEYLSQGTVHIDEKDYSIKLDDMVILWYSDTVDWADGWSWSSFGFRSSMLLEEMIKYLKEL